MELTQLLDRPGLEPEIRLLVAAKAAIAPGAWPRLAECVGTARDRGFVRADLEETILQAVLFYGFPRVVSAFEVLQTEWPADAPPAGGALPPAEQRAAGEQLFAQIYGDGAASVEAMLRSFHNEFCEFVLSAAYGRILTRPGLSPRTRELLAVGALAALDQLPQLVAHARGAMTFGATAGQVEEAVITALHDEAAAEAIMRRVLRIK